MPGATFVVRSGSAQRRGRSSIPLLGSSTAWGASNLPYKQGGALAWQTLLPAGVPVVPIQTSGGDFYTRFQATVNAQNGRAIIELPAGNHEFDLFRGIGPGGTYAFGAWNPKFAGFYTEADPETCTVGMAAGAVTAEQLDLMSQMTQASFAPLLMGLLRVDTQYNSAPAPIYFGGIGWESAPQPLLTTISGDITGGVYVPQSAPHQGLVIYSDSARRHPDSIITHNRFHGAGKAMTSQPPFEMGNLTMQKNDVRLQYCDFDGRMAARFDATRPVKCGPIMMNGGVYMGITNSWIHDSNVSRYAANDESVVSGTALSNHYYNENVTIERITHNQNKQPPLNSGNSLGGYTDASCFGWESSNSLHELINVTAWVNNGATGSQVPCHVQFTNTGAARTGGHLRVRGGSYRHSVYSQLDGYLLARVQTSSWWYTNLATAFDIQIQVGVPLTHHIYTGTWPPTQSYLDSNGLSPQTHYIVRGA